MTDGCTFFPEGSLERCCAEYGKLYWQGGSQQQRSIADVKLRECILDVTNNKIITFAIYGGSRIGGIPFIATPWRWGYGWDFGRGYR